jgi:hypothetical protein
VTGEWRKLHREELHNLYSSPDIIRQIKSTWMRWAGHVACMREERIVYKVLVEIPKARDHSEDQGVGGRMGLEWVLGRLAGGCGLDSTGSGQGPMAGYCERGDEPSGFCAAELVEESVGRGVTLTTHPHLVPRSWMSRSYTCSPTKRLYGV